MDGTTTAPSPLADAGYDTDFHNWSVEQARLIRTLTIPGLDSENVAEEIESLGRSDKRELLSRSTVLLAHLLKWQFQPRLRGDSWIETIAEQRRRIEMLLEESPSLRPTMPIVLARAYHYGRQQAADETKLPLETFPAATTWRLDEVYRYNWLPD